MITLTKEFEKKHPGLAALIGGMAPSLLPNRDLTVCDTSEEAAPGKNWIRVERNGTPALSQHGALVYDSPDSELTLAGLLAHIAQIDTKSPIAADPHSLAVFALAERIASTDIPALITGPTGTGKEVLSRFIHDRSSRAGRNFVALNCAAIPETMLEAVLFGHDKGAFTGASAKGTGLFREADGGTLLLDEIAEMPLALQAKLLRALQEGEVLPIGATRPVKVDVRIIACANRDLPTEVAEGRFREDLYYRLNVFPLQLDALRTRICDIAPLSCAMILRHSPGGKVAPALSPAALAALRNHAWPGNVRELENVIRRALILADGRQVIDVEDIVFDPAARLGDDACFAPRPAFEADVPMTEDASTPGNLAKIVQISEARAIMAAIKECGGKKIEAARSLGISERTLRYRLASFREAGIDMGMAV